MKLCRFNDNRLGVVEGDQIIDVSAALERLPAQRWPLPPGDQLISNLPEMLEAIKAIMPSAPTVSLDSASLLSPIANPNKVIGAPVNYYAHQQEAIEQSADFALKDIKTIEEYGLFLKTNVLVGPSEGVALLFPERRNDHEVEVAMIIGKQGKNISKEDALSYVAGYSIGLDMTVRGTEDRSLRKAIDSYAVLGPWMATADEIADPDALEFSIHVGDELRQKSNTEKLIFSCVDLIAYASIFYTLYPGDVIMTGTPEGVGPVADGDVMHCWAQSIGEMHVPVRNVA
jgi:2,4-diketo-3-deoxy-L-fuconate hydrolase